MVAKPAAPKPSAPKTIATAPEGGVIVGKGDTVYALSRRHKVSVRAIIDANRLAPPYHLLVGQVVMLPKAKEHRVAAGETLYSISRANGVDVATLARANGVGAPYTIKVGQVLRLPSPGTPAAPAKATVSPSVEKVAATTLAPPIETPNALRGARPTKKPQRPGVTRVSKASPAYEFAPRRKPRPSVRRVGSISKPPPLSGKGFRWPLKGRIISRYGPRAKGLHNDGVNIAAARGAPVRAAENGVVAYAGNQLRGFGKLILVKHSGGWITAYAHNDAIVIRRGDRVTRGQVIARAGSTGSVTRPQLHFELRRGKKTVNPEKRLKGA